MVLMQFAPLFTLLVNATLNIEGHQLQIKPTTCFKNRLNTLKLLSIQIIVLFNENIACNYWTNL